MKTLVLAGTKKGLFFFTSEDRQQWQLHGPFQNGREIYHAVYDSRSGRVYATANDAWCGSEVVRSSDLGMSWTAARQNPQFPADSGLKMQTIWHLEPGRPSEPQVLYAGVAPAALFRSEDGGETWGEVVSLRQHPTRPKWQSTVGGLCLHSISVDPSNARRMFVGISAVGVFRSDDDGTSWTIANQGTRAEFLPEKYPEFGQCVHKLLLADGQRSLLFQQNHCGVYRSADAGRSWQEITDGLPSEFGFPLALHPRERETLFVIPLKGPEFRCPPEGKLRVFRTRDGGKSWQPLTKGLPQENVFVGILREAMATDSLNPVGVSFGTNTGKIFASRDEGDSWRLLADDLPPVYSVSAAVL